MTKVLPERTDYHSYEEGIYIKDNYSVESKIFNSEHVINTWDSDYTRYRGEHANEVFRFNKSLIQDYFRDISHISNGIIMDPKLLSGMPTLKKTRIPVDVILANLKDQATFKDIVDDYGISEEQISDALDYVINILQHPYYDEDEVE